ncbi:MAG: FliH/SctL family protein [Armatimonadota bacterium]|nr:hypothetical protein [bacterium]
MMTRRWRLMVNNVIKSGGMCRDASVVVRPVNLSQQRNTGTTGPTPQQRAQAEADIIVRSAHAEAQSIREQAHAEGYKAGAEEAAGRFDVLMHKLESEITEADAERQAVLDQIEPEVLNLCKDIVEKVIRHEIKSNPQVLIRVIKSCLRRVKDSADARIKVNPAELAVVKAQRDELMSIADGIKTLSIIDDRRISPGGCVIETAAGDFDAKIETQIDRVNKKLGDTYEDGRSGEDS